MGLGVTVIVGIGVGGGGGGGGGGGVTLGDGSTDGVGEGSADGVGSAVGIGVGGINDSVVKVKVYGMHAVPPALAALIFSFTKPIYSSPYSRSMKRVKLRIFSSTL